MQLLREKLVRGTHHIFLDAELVPDRAERKRYLDYLGRIFEDYVEELLTRTYAHAIGNFIPEGVLKRYVNGSVCDGLIHVNDTVVLVEAKAKLFTLAAREWEGWDQYLSKLQDVFVGSARQINAIGTAIRSGALTTIGLDPKRIRSYLPLVVTLDDSAMNHLQYDRITRMIQEAGLLAQPNVSPIQVLDIGELEIWETGVSLGKQMHARLREKASSSETEYLTFGNYLARRGDSFVEKKNPHLLSVFDHLTKRTLADFRARQARQTPR